ncbi:MAG TPA: hypothetical protein VNQ77_03850 [Frankiaceae bacterium]|nr:hypothetical protein [Frankiaceae bacterium]
MRKTLARTGALLILTTVALPAPANAAASCSGDPCAAVSCTRTHASAAANGSEYAHAIASAGGLTAQAVKHGGGSATAEANGGLPTEADAKAKKNWSLAEDTAKCSVNASGQIGTDILDILEDPPVPVSIGCVSDDRITATESFAGRLHVRADGGLALVDSATGRGLSLVDLAAPFDGTSLDALAPVDSRGMTPTAAVVELAFVDRPDVSSCEAKLTL